MIPSTLRPILLAALLVGAVAAFCFLDPVTASGFTLTSLGAFTVGDRNFYTTKTLPASATTADSTGFDLGHGSARGDFLANCELKISAPALATGQLGDGATMKYTVQHDDDVAFGTAATLEADVITQTGAGGAGAAAATYTMRLPVDVKRYVRVRATNSAGNSSASSMTVELLF